MTARVNGRRLEALYGTGVVWTIESAALCDCCYKVWWCGIQYFLSSITIPKIPNNFCRLKFLVLHTFSTKLTDICLNHRGQGGHEKLLLTCSGVSPSSRQCFSHVWTAVVYPWETRANIFSCSFTTFSVGEICVFGRFRTFSDVFTL